jgi:hypothetical protein
LSAELVTINENTRHISYLSTAKSRVIDFLIEQIQSSSSSIVIEEEKEYEIDDILNSRYHYEKLQYRVK